MKRPNIKEITNGKGELIIGLVDEFISEQEHYINHLERSVKNKDKGISLEQAPELLKGLEDVLLIDGENLSVKSIMRIQALIKKAKL